jgi:hypothetical protein
MILCKHCGSDECVKNGLIKEKKDSNAKLALKHLELEMIGRNIH